jgi:hypothetical protein
VRRAWGPGLVVLAECGSDQSPSNEIVSHCQGGTRFHANTRDSNDSVKPFRSVFVCTGSDSDKMQRTVAVVVSDSDGREHKHSACVCVHNTTEQN